MNSVDPQKPSATSEQDLPYDPRVVLFWILLTTSVLCVLFAESLGTSLTTTQTGPRSYSGDPQLARIYTFKIYLFGGMSFVLAVAERIAVEIAALKDK